MDLVKNFRAQMYASLVKFMLNFPIFILNAQKAFLSFWKIRALPRMQIIWALFPTFGAPWRYGAIFPAMRSPFFFNFL
jgi:hypothetical protein